MTDLTVVRLTKPEHVDHPAVAALIARAVKAWDLPGLDGAAFHRELAAASSSPLAGIFLGRADKKPRGLLTGFLPFTASMLATPQFTGAYNEGPPALARIVAAAARDWLLASGFSSAMAINFKRKDAVWMRGMRHFGRPTRVGSIVRFDFGEETA